MTDNGAVFPLFYLPPVKYMALMARHKDDVELDGNEHLVKQTYRNRATIYSPEGPLSLVVPVIKGSKVHTQMKDVKISYDFKWQRLHWLSLQACYRRSAYFEYYEDELSKFYEGKPVYLFDLNLSLLEWALKKIKLSVNLKSTTDYIPHPPARADYRGTFHKKDEQQNDQQKTYFQVFEERQGFLANLSIVDLLFSQGPQTLNYL